MKCVFCKHGVTRPGVTNMTLDRGSSIVLFREVPADICENCGEPYVSADVAKKLLARAEESFARGVDLELVKYAA